MKTTLEKFCNAIQKFEGWKPGSRSYRNRNPGNLRYTSYTSDLGAKKADKQGFAVFSDSTFGYRALTQFVTDAANERIVWCHGGVTILQFFTGVEHPDGTFNGGYAPSRDHNDPLQYARFVAKVCGKKVDDPLKSIL